MEYYLSLGSNLGNKKLNLKKALSFLENFGEIIQTSSLYETTPMAMDEYSENFFNQVLCLKSQLGPPELLNKIKQFEKRMGRDISDSHCKSRKIDIDILLADNLIIETDNLSIPHREMTNRAFVLIPLEEIAPYFIHPVFKNSIKEIRNKLRTREVIKKISSKKSRK